MWALRHSVRSHPTPLQQAPASLAPVQLFEPAAVQMMEDKNFVAAGVGSLTFQAVGEGHLAPCPALRTWLPAAETVSRLSLHPERLALSVLGTDSCRHKAHD
eukprot:TRINITY_DN118_c0_g1_i1.p3 TRINITY_DN118_c0_g1~~TRINITY_DN118_c0_g1_i1.p3  ORF type:complete len:102 (-),score=9.91 TRINITY_DN118_c0_g1_i1:198-503(-)